VVRFSSDCLRDRPAPVCVPPRHSPCVFVRWRFGTVSSERTRKIRDVGCHCMRPRGCVNGRHLPVRRALLGWPSLCHLGCDTWCLRSSVADLRRIRPKGQCICAPSVLSLHLAARTFPPERTQSRANSNGKHHAGCLSPWQRHRCHCVRFQQTFLGFFSPPMHCVKAPIAAVPRPRPRPDVQVWPIRCKITV